MTNIKFNLSKPTPPMMPRLGKGTECVQLLLSQVSKDMHQPLVPMLFSILGAHVSGAEFMYPDQSWKEMCGMMANLVADSGAGKGQLSGLVEALCRDFRAHDEEEMAKLSDCWAMLSAGHKAIAIPSATLLSQADKALLRDLAQRLGTSFHMFPDRDAPGERLFMQLKEVLPGLQHHQLPVGCKDFAEYYVSALAKNKLGG